MARIKTFQGAGPNPNVPFVGDLPRPQYIGQAENAVSKLADTIGKGAKEYMEMQQRQKDLANVAEADAAKVMFDTEMLESPQYYQDDGTINIDFYKENLTKFYDTLKSGMSKNAYAQWSARQQVMDARQESTMRAENLKRTRGVNLARSLEALDILASNASISSMEGMQDSYVNISNLLEGLVSNGDLELDKAIKLERELKQKTLKSYIDNALNTAKSVEAKQADINGAIDKGLALIEADPLNVYKKDTGLAEGTKAYLQEQRLSLMSRLMNKELQDESKSHRDLMKVQKANLSGFLTRLRSATNEHGRVDPIKYNEITSEARAAFQNDDLDEAGLRRVINFDVNMAKISDESFYAQALAAPDLDSAKEAIKYIQNPKMAAQAIERALAAPPDYRGDFSFILGLDKKRRVEITEDYFFRTQAFDDVKLAVPSLKLDSEDLKQAMAFKYMQRNDYAFEELGKYTQYLIRINQIKAGTSMKDARNQALRRLEGILSLTNDFIKKNGDKYKENKRGFEVSEGLKKGQLDYMTDKYSTDPEDI